MNTLPASLEQHRVSASHIDSVTRGTVHYSPIKSFWFLGMASAAVIGGAMTFRWSAFLLFMLATGTVLLLGHSLGSHRKLIHNSYDCPKWLEYLLVYCGVQVGLAGPIGLLRQHELRDYAQRLPDCHDYLRHGRSFWLDAWWQLNCELRLDDAPRIEIESAVADDRFYRILERTWMAQQLPVAILFYLWGGWAFVFWGACARITAGVFGHWLIGYFAHNHGSKHFHVDGAAVQGQNIRLTSLLTMGECWHNNHHAYPGSAKLGLLPGEWDPGWWALLLLRRVGLVRNIRLPEHLPYRAELLALDDCAAVHLGPQQAPSGTSRERPARMPLMDLLRLFFAPNKHPHISQPVMVWPGSVMPERVMRLMLGKAVKPVHDPAAPRMQLSIGTKRLFGLPAACVAVAQRNVLLAVGMLVLLPVANAVERTRLCLEL